MSKYRYLEVQACLETWLCANVSLPDGWDMMTDEQRLACIKNVAATEILDSVRHDEYEYGKQIRYVTESDFTQWSVYSNTRKTFAPLEQVATKPEAFLILDGTYEQREDMNWDED